MAPPSCSSFTFFLCAVAPVNASRGHFFVNNQEAGEKTVDDPGIEISVGIWRPQSLKRKVSEWWISKPGSLNIRQNGFLELFDQQSLSSIWII